MSDEEAEASADSRSPEQLRQLVLPIMRFSTEEISYSHKDLVAGGRLQEFPVEPILWELLALRVFAVDLGSYIGYGGNTPKRAAFLDCFYAVFDYPEPSSTRTDLSEFIKDRVTRYTHGMPMQLGPGFGYHVMKVMESCFVRTPYSGCRAGDDLGSYALNTTIWHVRDVIGAYEVSRNDV